MNKGKIRTMLFKHRKYVLFFGIICFFISYTMLLDYREEWKIARKSPRAGIVVEKTDESQGILLADGITVEQELALDNMEFQGFSLYFEETLEIQQGRVIVELKDKTSGKRIYRWRRAAKRVSTGNYVDFILKKKVALEEEKDYIISIYTTGVNCSIRLATSTSNDSSKNKLYIDDILQNEILAHRIMTDNFDSLKYVARIFYVVMCVTLFVTLIAVLSNLRLEVVFIGVSLCTGIMYILALPPGAVPDEPTHFLTAYAHSSGILGIEQFDSEGKVILEDTSLWTYEQRIATREEYDTYFSELSGNKITEEKTEIATSTPLEMRHLGYVAQVIGITVGRVLGFNSGQLYFLGRFLALCLYILLMYWAIKLIPYGKMALYTIGLMPMTMQMVGSFNYDSIVFGTCFLLFAILLNLLYGNRNINCKDVIVLSLLSFIIAGIKFVYLPILAIGLFIQKEKFGSLKNKILAITWLSVLSISTIVYVKLEGILGILGVNASKPSQPLDMITIGYCIENPIEIFNIFWRTFERELDLYSGQMVGTPLGWLEINIPKTVVLAFISIIIFSMVYEKGTYVEKIPYLKPVTWIITGVIMFITMAALLFDCTPIISPILGGFQGRYWIPILPLGIILLKNSWLVCKKDFNKYFILTISFLNCYAISVLTSSIVSR